jgi:hypothetical protein
MARFYRVYFIDHRQHPQRSSVMRHTSFACGLGLYSARFNFAILRARLALASRYPWSLAPACCTERIDFSASSADTEETQKEKEATTIRLAVLAGLGKRQKTTYS